MFSSVEISVIHPFSRWGTRLAFLLLIASAPTVVQAQLVINEVCSKNHTVLDNGTGSHPDWIEVYNAGSSPISLGDFYLSDVINDPAPWNLPNTQLLPGEYEVFLSGVSDQSDHWFPFSLSHTGEILFLSESNGSLVEAFVVPYLLTDNSYGRWNGGEYRYFGTPTPGAANTTEAYLGYASTPSFDHEPGFVGQGTTLVLASDPNTTIRVTVDGSEPNSTSQEYSGPLALNNTLVIKAVAYGQDLLPSETASNTYLVSEHTELAVVSISVHPDSLFDDTLGLYMLGPNADPDYPHYGANFWSERSVAVRIEYFDEQHHRGLDQVVDLKMHGGRVSRNQPQRPFRLSARKHYGSDLMEYQFFPEKPALNKFHTLILRNSGADWCIAEQRDQVWHQTALHGGLNVDALAYRPVAVYINGAYWGLMELRERIDDDYLHYNYGADRSDLLLMEEENVSIQGDTIHFHDLKEYIYGHDMNDPVHYAYVDSLLDIKSFMDYAILEMYAGNVDWPSNNLKYWKPSINEGKWRYLLYDLDATMNIFGWIPIDLDSFYWVLIHRAGFVHAEIFRSMLGNDEFKRKFLNRMADLLNTGLSEETFGNEIRMNRDRIVSEIPRHYARWGCYLPQWEDHAYTIIPNFAELRGDIMREDVLSTFELPNTALLEFDVFPAAAGTIALNTLDPQLPFRGIYFNGNAIDLSTTANNGYVFDHWEYEAGTSERIPERSIQRSFGVDGKLMAYYRKEGESLSVFPNPFTDRVELSLFAEQDGDAAVQLVDVEGRILVDRNQKVQRGVNSMVLNLGPLSNGVYILWVELNGTSVTQRLVRTASSF